MPLLIIWMIKAPSTTPRAEPRPPERLAPPTTAAAITLNS